MADDVVFPQIPNDLILKFLIFGGVLAFVLLIISFQYVFAVIVLIVAIISLVLLKNKQQI